MKIFNFFGYRITIRKIKENRTHPMNTRAYHSALMARREKATFALKKEVYND